MGVSKSCSKCTIVGIRGVAWAFGGMIFALVYRTTGISKGYINPASYIQAITGKEAMLDTGCVLLCHAVH
ncbi:hypothetical protein CRG98_011653 [Punica granatum]|uniref:Uncharacterized protein n=1 Tax=Punica granatum TaxID=22663 RepID=A0A2I0KHQ2_PUNGR|nr:hypothetical protein CRG98_011653 [Punica granatum]